MSTNPGIDAHLSTTPWSFIRGYKDGFEVGGDRKIETVFIEGAQGTSIHARFGLTPNHEFTCDSISFLFLIDGEPMAFRSYKLTHLQALLHQVQQEVFTHKDYDLNQPQAASTDLTFGEPTYESNVELQVFRMNAPGKRAGGIKKRDRYRVIAGQMIARGSRLGPGTHFVVSEDRSQLEHSYFMNGVENPWATFRWRYMTRDMLERLLIIPQSPNVPEFKLLPKQIKLLDEATSLQITLESPINGLSLRQMDSLAYDCLDKIKVYDLTLEEVERLASDFQYCYSLTAFTPQQLQEFAALQLVHEIQGRLHNITLAALACHYEEGFPGDTIGYAMAAKSVSQECRFNRDRLLEERNWSVKRIILDSRLRYRAQTRERALTRVKKLTVAELEAIWQERYLDRDMKSVSTKEELYLMVAKKFIEEEYLAAKVQVVSVLAEMHLQELKEQRSKVEANEKKRPRADAADGIEDTSAKRQEMEPPMEVQKRSEEVKVLPIRERQV